MKFSLLQLDFFERLCFLDEYEELLKKHLPDDEKSQAIVFVMSAKHEHKGRIINAMNEHIFSSGGERKKQVAKYYSDIIEDFLNINKEYAPK